MEDETVRCQDCGFLSCRPNSQDEPLPEVELAMRQDGDRPHPPPHTYEPACFRDVFDLPAEYGSPAFADKRGAFLTVVQLGRVCRKFVEYQPGLTPQDHMDTIDEQKAELRQMLREKAEFKLKMAEEKRKNDLLEAQLEHDRKSSLRKDIITLAVAVIVFVGGIYAAYTAGKATVEAADRKAVKSAD